MIEAELSLSELVVFGAGLILALIAYYIAKSLSIVTDLIPFFGGDVSGAIESALVKPAQGLVNSAEAKVSKGFNDLVDALELVIGITALLGLGVVKALTYLWQHAIAPRVKSVMGFLTTQVQGIAQDLLAVKKLVATDLGIAEKYADAAVSDATHTIEATLRKEIATARSTAESYADNAVSTLRKAEDTALGKAVAAANAGIAAAEAAAHTAETEAEAFARSEVAKAEALANTAIADVRGIAVGVGDDVENLVGKYGIAGAAGLIASIPLLATLVNTIASESGLDNSACRAKVKGICGTDPNAWGRLLAGLAALGFAFSLKELYEVAEPLVADLAPVIAKAA